MRRIAIISLTMCLAACSSEVADDGAEEQGGAIQVRNRAQQDDALAARFAKFKIVIGSEGVDLAQAPPAEQTTANKTLWRTDYFSSFMGERDWSYEESEALRQIWKELSYCRFEALTTPQAAGTTVSLDAGDKYRTATKATRSGETVAFRLIDVKDGADAGVLLRCVPVLGPGDKKAKYGIAVSLEPPTQP